MPTWRSRWPSPWASSDAGLSSPPNTASATMATSRSSSSASRAMISHFFERFGLGPMWRPHAGQNSASARTGSKQCGHWWSAGGSSTAVGRLRTGLAQLVGERLRHVHPWLEAQDADVQRLLAVDPQRDRVRLDVDVGDAARIAPARDHLGPGAAGRAPGQHGAVLGDDGAAGLPLRPGPDVQRREELAVVGAAQERSQVVPIGLDRVVGHAREPRVGDRRRACGSGRRAGSRLGLVRSWPPRRCAA